LERRSSCSSTISLSDSYSTISSTSSNKSCSFRDEPEILLVPAVETLIENPGELWFQQEDFEHFREKTRRIISNVDENGRGKNGKKYCTRGLERYMPYTQGKRKDIRKNILQALDEGDSVSLRDHSRSCVAEALDRGDADAKVAISYNKRYLPWMRSEKLY